MIMENTTLIMDRIAIQALGKHYARRTKTVNILGASYVRNILLRCPLKQCKYSY